MDDSDGRRLGEHALDRGQTASERRRPAPRLEQRRAEREEVHRRGASAGQGLGRRVTERSARGAVARNRRAGQPEIDQDRAPIAGETHVRRTEVGVNDAPPVQVRERARELLGGALHRRAARRLVRDVRQGID